MSADRQRLVNSIRRIALTPEERRKLLGDSANRGDQAGAGAKAASQGEEEKICCDGSTAGANLGTSERDPGASSQTGGLDSADPAKLTSGEGTLSGVTDCATGEPICFDGSGFIPPDDWDSPTEPPEEPSYEEGFYWTTSGGSGGTALDLASACLEAYPDDGGNYSLNCPLLGAEFCCTNSVGNPLASASKVECSGQAVCDEPVPTADAWPSDGCVNLAIINGTIVGSQYDPDNDGTYSTPLSEINLCSGGEQIKLAPSADGGWKTINATPGDDGYLYDSKGQQIARISGDEYSDPTI